eukprot:174071_1
MAGQRYMHLFSGHWKPKIDDSMDKKGGLVYSLESTLGCLFSAKEAAQIMILNVLEAHIPRLHTVGHSPTLDKDKTEMSDWSLMREWRHKGKEFTKNKKEDIDRLAKFLLEFRDNDSHEKARTE